jgi:DNA modification methylase
MMHHNTILKADCLHALPQLAPESIQFILTDPPYITRYKSRDGRTVPNDDNAAWLKPAFAEMYRVLAPDSFCVSFLRMAPGRPVYAGLPRRRFPHRGALCFPEALHIFHPVPALSA